MTYTFKLARRLAVSRTFAMLPAIFLFAACSGGDTTAPEGDPLGPQDGLRSRETAPVAVSINPSSVTVETNQLIRFLVHGWTSAGDSVSVPIRWHATGGTILPDGRFSSAAVGSFMVTGSTLDRGQERIDTSVVRVVRRQPQLTSIEISPESTTLAPGVTQAFLVTGRMKDGRAVPVGAVWNATGGTIDAGGNYVAGDTAGTYRVIATNTSLTIADTAVITITAPPAPTPPLAPAPPEDSLAPPEDSLAPQADAPAPTLATVTLLPSSATLAPLATRQFTAYGTTTAGDSVAVSVSFVATGGTVTTGGLYTAGSNAGSFRVIAASGALADTSAITVTDPLGSGPGAGVPFGPFAIMQADGWRYGRGPVPFNLNTSSIEPADLAKQIAVARSAGMRLVLGMTGGSHTQYLTNGVFDMAKWKARQKAFDTSTNRTAVAEGVADGTVVAASLMDEPEHSSWGGVINKSVVDQMSMYTKSIFPTLPTAVVTNYMWLQSQTYKHLDLIITQYSPKFSNRDGWETLSTFRSGAVATAKANKTGLMFSMNVIDWTRAATTGTPCPIPQTGGVGSLSGDMGVKGCRITPAELESAGLALGLTPEACGLLMWKYDTLMFDRADYQSAASKVRSSLNTRPGASCRRTL